MAFSFYSNESLSSESVRGGGGCSMAFYFSCSVVLVNEWIKQTVVRGQFMNKSQNFAKL